MTTFDATVREVVSETSDTVTLVFEDAPRDYVAGQFLNIDPLQLGTTKDLAADLEKRKGKKERPRAYSLASAPHEPHVAITVKPDAPGAFPSLLSPYLVERIRPGDRLPCAGYAGLYTLPPELPAGAHVVHICAGSGIVPNYSILKDALHRALPVRQTLLYSNRTWDDVIYRDALARLETAHSRRFRAVHFLTRDAAGAPQSAIGKRLARQHIEEHVSDPMAAWYFLCGPSVPTFERVAARKAGTVPQPRFLEAMRALLLEMGIPKQQVSVEGW